MIYFGNCLREVILDLCGVFVFVFDLPKVIFLNQGSSDVYLYFDVFYIYEISTILVQNIYYIFILLCSSYIKVICNTEKYAGEAKICTYFSVKIFQFMMKEGTNSGVSMICPKNLNSI